MAIIVGTVLVGVGAQSPMGTAGSESPSGGPKSDAVELMLVLRWLQEHKTAPGKCGMAPGPLA